jgi:hypothetical protein
MLEEEEVLEANQEDFDPISDDEENTLEMNGNHDVVCEDTDLVIGVAEATPGNVHEQDAREEENVEAPLLPPPITQPSERFQRRSSGKVTTPSRGLQGYNLY